MPWDPVRDLLTMEERLESLFGRAMPGWVPPADLCETASAYILTLELPGFRREDVDLKIHDSRLIVRGERASDQCCPDRYQQLERGQGHFSRSFHFTHPVSGDEISADLADGVLTVVIPKATPESRRIDVG